MKIFSYNSRKHSRSIPEIINFILQEKFDVVLIQEVNRPTAGYKSYLQKLKKSALGVTYHFSANTDKEFESGGALVLVLLRHAAAPNYQFRR